MRYLLAVAVLALAGCSDMTGPSAKMSQDSGTGCGNNAPTQQHEACTGQNPSKHNP